MLRIAILALLLAGLASAAAPASPPFGGGAGEEEKIPWEGYTIAISQSTEPANVDNPWRWRIDGADGQPIANAFGWVKTRDDAITAGKNAIAAMMGKVVPPPAPGVPIPTPTPPPKEGAGEAVLPPPPAPTNCEVLRSDGTFSICLYRPTGSPSFAYRALDGAGMPVATEGGFATKMDAQIAAWRMLAPMPTTIASSVRHGVALASNGDLQLVDVNAYLARATPVLVAELAKGEADPRGLVLAIFQQFWPSVNPFRLRPAGASLEVAANKLAAKIPAGPADMARSIFTISAVVNLG